MTLLLDTNILVRTADPADALHSVAAGAVSALQAQGHSLCIVPQSPFEFWFVATRPLDKNGLGLSASECLAELARFKGYYPLLLDSPDLYGEWESLVSLYACHGKVAHDARYVAAMKTHGLTHLLTFNVSDFARYPGITVLDPKIAAAPANVP